VHTFFAGSLPSTYLLLSFLAIKLAISPTVKVLAV
jgi:hypothetical protein